MTITLSGRLLRGQNGAGTVGSAGVAGSGGRLTNWRCSKCGHLGTLALDEMSVYDAVDAITKAHVSADEMCAAAHSLRFVRVTRVPPTDTPEGKHPAAVALGKMTSVRKKVAARANGRKGGRPRKVKA